METVSRTIRFNSEDIELIDEFLDKNTFLDFSSLTRLALMEFIKNPKLQITPIEPRKHRAVSKAKDH